MCDEDDDLAFLRHLPSAGPPPALWPTLDATLARLLARGCDVTDPAVAAALPAVLADPRTLVGHVRAWPHGRPGDFEILDRLHRNARSAEAPLWDAYVQDGAAGRAVRGRARFFLDRMAAEVARRGRLRLLDLACGPCRDLAALYGRLGARAPQTDAVDSDAAALTHAARVLGPRPGLRLIRADAFRYRPDRAYDVIWCAGLADYLSDRALGLLLRRCRGWAAPGAVVILGNFTPRNPQRPQMDFCGWPLVYRTEAALEDLARAAFPGAPVRIEHEETGINAFCVIG